MDSAPLMRTSSGRFARVTAHTQRFVYSPQVCFWRSLDAQRLDPAILYCWMQSDDLKGQIAAVAGQTDMAPYVSLRDQRQMEILIATATKTLLRVKDAARFVAAPAPRKNASGGASGCSGR